MSIPNIDVYELPHGTRFNKIINIYSNSNIEYIVNKYVDENYITDKESLKSNIFETINDIKNGLKILNNRVITSISARICSRNFTGYTVWDIITIYRGEEENSNNMIF